MGNHFHLVIETPLGNLVGGMKWFLGTYTLRFNRRHKLFGHLFSGRYKSLIVDGSGSGYLKTVEEGRAEATGEEWKGLRRGWYLGDEAFRQELLQAAQAQVGRNHYGVERQETAEQRARRIVSEEFKRRGWTETSLSQLHKGDAGKVPIARRLRAETTVTLQWIAAALAMGTWTHVANQLSHASLPA
jgi:hypothetical protein